MVAAEQGRRQPRSLAGLRPNSGSLVTTTKGLFSPPENGCGQPNRFQREPTVVSSASGTQVAKRETENKCMESLV